MNWRADFNFSRQHENVAHACTALRRLLREPGAVIEPADPQLDYAGADYVVTLPGGLTLLVDEKRRRAGCSRYWRRGPELFLERWCIRPGPGHRGVPGWTLQADALTDFVLFTFDPVDTPAAFLVPFHLLRLAMERHADQWAHAYGQREQHQAPDGGPPKVSVSVPVPWAAVRDAIGDAMATSPITFNPET